MLVALFNEYGRAYIWCCESKSVAMTYGIGCGVVEQTQHILLNNHIVASHLGDEHVFETDGVGGNSKLAVNHVAVSGEAECIVRLIERQLII